LADWEWVWRKWSWTLRNMLWGWEIDGTDSGLCLLMVGFGIGGVEASSFTFI
jgi:hypothetical protein